MKNREKLCNPLALTILLMIAVLYSCNDQEPEIMQDNDIDKIEGILKLRNTNSSLRDNSNEGSRTHDGECPSISQTNHDDGSTTVLLDFGDGCLVDSDLHTILRSGMIKDHYLRINEEVNGSEDSIKYFVNNIDGLKEYIDFSLKINMQNNITQNGTSNYSISEESEISNEKIIFANISTQQIDSLSITETNANNEETSYFIITNTSSLNEIGSNGDFRFTINKMDHSYQSATDHLTSTLITPLVGTSECFDRKTPTYPIQTGIEEIVFNNKKYTLNYGNGECDNQAILTAPNGETFIVDL